VEDVNQRYLGKAPSEEAPSQPKTSSTHKPVQATKPSISTRPSTQSRSSSQPHTTSSSSSYHRPSYKKPSSSSKKDSKGSWNLFKKKEYSQVQRSSSPPQRRPVTKHAITHSGEWDKTIYCKALYDFYGDMPCDLQFKKGQRIAIVTRTETQDDWWEGTVNGQTGIFPANYVSL